MIKLQQVQNNKIIIEVERVFYEATLRPQGNYIPFVKINKEVNVDKKINKEVDKEGNKNEE